MNKLDESLREVVTAMEDAMPEFRKLASLEAFKALEESVAGAKRYLATKEDSNAARGIINGVLLSIPLWALILWGLSSLIGAMK